MTTFKINKNLEVVCEAKSTRNGFKHVATLLRDGREIDEVKCCYLNRTWECYEFESVLEKLAGSDRLTDKEAKKFKKLIKNGFKVADKKRTDKEFNRIATLAKLGEIFGSSQKEKNDWKTCILKAGLENKGLIIPEDWDTLDESTKQARLDAVIRGLT